MPLSATVNVQIIVGKMVAVRDVLLVDAFLSRGQSHRRLIDPLRFQHGWISYETNGGQSAQ